MWKKLAVPILLIFTVVGCGNLSPRDNFSPQLQQELDNVNGKINGVETNQNAIKLEMMRLAQELGISNSQLRDLQQGMFNIQSGINNNEGIQILQGSGGLIFAFALLTIGMLLYYFHKAKKNEKTAKLLAQQIRVKKDQDLEQRILTAALNTNVEKDIYNLVRG